MMFLNGLLNLRIHSIDQVSIEFLIDQIIKREPSLQKQSCTKWVSVNDQLGCEKMTKVNQRTISMTSLMNLVRSEHSHC